ncbi:hypothetical protein M427DRAFT_36736 [Gonapodya prolifera JEL478]|uniref:Uncharacterized protein n=1 Tax=Gonapodya prolifera (strain JEL478) TaxID=1344416 RepID=A0A139A273_GONPJ|nr:hypothetical protein M427DRAFT_36736 [Gonapodya prolifera JEL478]|eukprot:KXS10738.1 hypothetical protein M427DRAFT_36736 [Gonapodya prolifera JEL478]
MSPVALDAVAALLSLRYLSEKLYIAGGVPGKFVHIVGTVLSLLAVVYSAFSGESAEAWNGVSGSPMSSDADDEYGALTKVLVQFNPRTLVVDSGSSPSSSFLVDLPIPSSVSPGVRFEDDSAIQTTSSLREPEDFPPIFSHPTTRVDLIPVSAGLCV